MPMTNGESREYAVKTCHCKGINALTQTGPNCTAYVAIWLRKRSRNKQFVMNQYFRLTEQDGSVARFDDMDEHGRPGRAAMKAETMQARMKGNAKVEQTYIMTGSKGATQALKLVDSRSAKMISNKRWDGVGMYDLIKELGANKQLASIGIHTDVPHALGVDCSQKQAAYFDPNLGELTFSNAEWLAYWWANCFRHDRKENPKTRIRSAWSVMTDALYTVEIYQRV
jgi:hypothetical protein